MEDKRTEQYRQELKEFVMSHTEDVLKNPRSFIRYPFIDPGSVYDGNVWDWDTYWSVYGFLNLADSYQDPSVKPRIIEHAQGNIRNFFDHQLEDGYIPMMIEVADWPEPYLNMRHKEGKIMNMHKPFLCSQMCLISDYTGDYDISEKVQNCFEDPIANVPLLVKPANQFACEPRISNALVELVDLTQTVCDMTGIQTEYIQFGKSLLDTLAGNEFHKEAVFCEGGRIHGETWAMESGHGPESTYWPRLDTQSSEGPEHTKATMIRMKNLKYVKRLYEQDELYDLDNDPQELNNIIEDPGYYNEVIKMKDLMLTFYQATGDIVPNRRDKR